MQAKVKSAISQFFKHLSPNFSEKYSSTNSVAYVADGLEASRALSVPIYILPISFGSILFFSNRLIRAFAANDEGSSLESAIAIFSNPRPLFNFS